MWATRLHWLHEVNGNVYSNAYNASVQAARGLWVEFQLDQIENEMQQTQTQTSATVTIVGLQRYEWKAVSTMSEPKPSWS